MFMSKDWFPVKVIALSLDRVIGISTVPSPKKFPLDICCHVLAIPSNFKKVSLIGLPSGKTCVNTKENGLHKSNEFKVTIEEASDVTEGSLRKLVSWISFFLSVGSANNLSSKSSVVFLP